MSVIATTRGDIADTVETATTIRAFTYPPERIQPPCAVVMPGSPYIEDGDTFGSFTARYTIDLIMGTAANSITTNGLDAQIENALVGLTNAGYSIETISQPYSMDANNATYLAATITVKTNIRP